MEDMFFDCYNLISLPDIHLINTQNVTNVFFCIEWILCFKNVHAYKIILIITY